MKMQVLKQSWSAFTPEIAKDYLDGYGHPSERSKQLVASLLKELFGGRRFRIADFGCGNGHLSAFFRSQGLACEYFGYDFSNSLLDAGRLRFAGDAETHFAEADIEDPGLVVEPCDIVVYSHVLETLQSPQRSLLAARKTAPLIMSRFFEPPIGEFDITELRWMDVGRAEKVPYLRRTMSRQYYNMILDQVGCKSVDVHQVDGDIDQVHVLKFE
jgi:SAM-dependent methyltransferase